MRKTPYLICLLMILTSLSGCIGGEDVETSEGEDVELGETTDDWPTYYVPSANDLPTCDANTLGRLYYVEADTNFQACMSTGWQVVQIGGASANVLVNQPPRIAAQIIALDDDLHNFSPNGWSFVGMAHWSAIDPEGETVTVGIDADRDGIIDINLNSSEGASIVELPWNGSIQITQIEADGERFLHLFRIFDMIAEDASGATSTISIISTAMQGPGIHDIFDADDVSDNDFAILFPTVPQSDIDWLGQPPTSSNPYFYVATDHSADASAATDDKLFVLELTQGDYDLDWAFVDVIVVVDNGAPIYCTTGTNDDCTLTQFGSDDTTWELSEIIHVTENGVDMCTTTCTIDITIQFDGNTLSGTNSVTVD